MTPAGSSQPPISIGAWRRRTTAGTTGRRRSVSLTTASRYSLVAGARLLAQPASTSGCAHQPLERPGERGGGRLVAGDEQRHQLVAQLVVAQRRAVRVAGGQQQREDVVALGAVRVARRARISSQSSTSARARIAAKRAPRARAVRCARGQRHARAARPCC